MTCPNCDHENPVESNFCGQCGASLRDQPETPDDSGPKQLAGGRYEVQRFLGEGGRKRVYLAHDTMLDRDVAIGIVKTSGLDEEGRVRVLREAQSMARLGDHPHVVTVHDIGEEAGDPYIVSQYMAGGALDDPLADAPGRPRAPPPTPTLARGGTHAHRRAAAPARGPPDPKPA